VPSGDDRRIYPGLTREALLARAAAFEEFAEWEKHHPISLDPSQALAAVGWLYELLPEAARQRPVDASGVQELHRCLAGLNRRDR
jgi:hypothetical protein